MTGAGRRTIIRITNWADHNWLEVRTRLRDIAAVLAMNLLEGFEAMPSALLGAWVVLTGAIVGSFLNVVVARVPHGQSVVHPRSRCPRCGASIAWYDNLPVISWVLLRARCRGCRAPISARYPLVELLGAGAAYLSWTRQGLSLGALAEFAFVSALLALAFIDLDTWLLPNAITWPLIATGLLANGFGLAGAGTLLSAATGAGIGFATFALISVLGEKVFHREALGFGDVWLLAGLGAWLGVGALLPVTLLASVQGTLVGWALMLLGKATPGPEEKKAANGASPADGSKAAAVGPAGDEWIPPKNAVPFGPFLAAAALEWLFLSGLLARLIPPLEVFR